MVSSFSTKKPQKFYRVSLFFDPTSFWRLGQKSLTKNCCFWLKRWHQKVLLKLTDLYIPIILKNQTQTKIQQTDFFVHISSCRQTVINLQCACLFLQKILMTHTVTETNGALSKELYLKSAARALHYLHSFEWIILSNILLPFPWNP